MDALTSTAAGGLRARMESLDMLANNLANAETAGYKTDREFYSLYVGEEAAATQPVIERAWTDFTQGVLRPTGNPLDLALSGKGFLAVEGPTGPLYTRHGAFRISPAGLVVTAEGYPVRLTGGAPLQAQAGLPLEIGTDGTVRQEGQDLGRLEVVSFADPAALAKQGHSYFRNTDPATAPLAASEAEVQQGKLENSNVGPAESAVRLVNVMRQFEMLQKAIALGVEMNRKALEEVARV